MTYNTKQGKDIAIGDYLKVPGGVVRVIGFEPHHAPACRTAVCSPEWYREDDYTYALDDESLWCYVPKLGAWVPRHVAYAHLGPNEIRYSVFQPEDDRMAEVKSHVYIRSCQVMARDNTGTNRVVAVGLHYLDACRLIRLLIQRPGEESEVLEKFSPMDDIR